MKKTYEVEVHCENCDSYLMLKIAKGTSVKKYLSKKENKKCQNCENLSLKEI